MPQAAIRWDGNTGHYSGLSLNTPVTISNVNSGGELTYDFQLVNRPVGSSASLVPVSGFPDKRTLTPDQKGTYIVRLVVNGYIADVSTADVQYSIGLREPAVGETTEMDPVHGWAGAAREIYEYLESLVLGATELTPTLKDFSNNGSVLSIAEVRGRHVSVNTDAPAGGGATALTLPTVGASENGMKTSIKNIGANGLLLLAGAGTTIDGALSFTYPVQYFSLSLEYVHSELMWQIF